MVMEILQVRLPKGLITELNHFVGKGHYASKSDVVRDAIRKLILQKQVGSVSDTGDSVEEVKAVRKKLSAHSLSLDDVNNL